jgi:hypothetical protein
MRERERDGRFFLERERGGFFFYYKERSTEYIKRTHVQ